MKKSISYSKLGELKAGRAQQQQQQLLQQQHHPQHEAPPPPSSPAVPAAPMQQDPPASQQGSPQPAPRATNSAAASPQQEPSSREVVAQLGNQLRTSKLHGLARRQAPAPEPRPMPQPTSKPRAKPPALALSAVLRQQPQLFDRAKVSVVERFVTLIDVLPARYQEAQVVYLSKNSLGSLSNLSQFTSVRVLSLSDNLLVDLEAVLDELSHLPHLEVLSLEGNPCSRTPYYRSRALARLPSLKVLDGQPVDESEASAAGALVEQEQAYLAVMMQNACMVHKLARVYQQQQVHRELFATLYGRKAWLVRGRQPASVPVNPQRLLELWDYEGSLTAQEREMLTAALRREITRNRRLVGVTSDVPAAHRTWRDAFSQVMLSQQQTIAQLLELVHDAKADLQDEVDRCVVPRFALWSAENELARNQGLVEDREQLLVSYRDAFHHLSPGSKVVTSSSRPRTAPPARPHTDAQTPSHMQAHATRALFAATQGSPVSAHTYSPSRKLRIETQHRPAGRIRPAPARPTRTTPAQQGPASAGPVGSRPAHTRHYPSPGASSVGADGPYAAPAPRTTPATWRSTGPEGLYGGPSRTEGVGGDVNRMAAAARRTPASAPGRGAGLLSGGAGRSRSAEGRAGGRAGGRMQSEAAQKLSLRRAARREGMQWQQQQQEAGEAAGVQGQGVQGTRVWEQGIETAPTRWKLPGRSPTRSPDPAPMPWSSSHPHDPQDHHNSRPASHTQQPQHQPHAEFAQHVPVTWVTTNTSPTRHMATPPSGTHDSVTGHTMHHTIKHTRGHTSGRRMDHPADHTIGHASGHTTGHTVGHSSHPASPLAQEVEEGYEALLHTTSKLAELTERMQQLQATLSQQQLASTALLADTAAPAAPAAAAPAASNDQAEDQGGYSQQWMAASSNSAQPPLSQQWLPAAAASGDGSSHGHGLHQQQRHQQQQGMPEYSPQPVPQPIPTAAWQRTSSQDAMHGAHAWQRTSSQDAMHGVRAWQGSAGQEPLSLLSGRPLLVPQGHAVQQLHHSMQTQVSPSHAVQLHHRMQSQLPPDRTHSWQPVSGQISSVHHMGHVGHMDQCSPSTTVCGVPAAARAVPAATGTSAMRHEHHTTHTAGPFSSGARPMADSGPGPAHSSPMAGSGQGPAHPRPVTDSGPMQQGGYTHPDNYQEDVAWQTQHTAPAPASDNEGYSNDGGVGGSGGVDSPGGGAGGDGSPGGGGEHGPDAAGCVVVRRVGPTDRLMDLLASGTVAYECIERIAPTSPARPPHHAPAMPSHDTPRANPAFPQPSSSNPVPAQPASPAFSAAPPASPSPSPHAAETHAPTLAYPSGPLAPQGGQASPFPAPQNPALPGGRAWGAPAAPGWLPQPRSMLAAALPALTDQTTSTGACRPAATRHLAYSSPQAAAQTPTAPTHPGSAPGATPTGATWSAQQVPAAAAVWPSQQVPAATINVQGGQDRGLQVEGGDDGDGATAGVVAAGMGQRGASASHGHHMGHMGHLRLSVDSGLRRVRRAQAAAQATATGLKRVSSAGILAMAQGDDVVPITAMAVKELETELVSGVLERSALQHALLAEQGEQALLRHELGTQVDASLALEAALVEAHRQLNDANCALAVQTEAVEELEVSCEELHVQGEASKAAGDTLKEQLQRAQDQLQQTQEALVQALERQAAEASQYRSEQEALAAKLQAEQQQAAAQLQQEQQQAEQQRLAGQSAFQSRLQQEQQEWTAQLQAARQQHTVLLARNALDATRLDVVDMLSWRSLARRALHRFRRGTALSYRQRIAHAAATKLSTWWRAHRCVRHWRYLAVQGRAVQGMAARVQGGRRAAALHEAWRAWRAYHRGRRVKEAGGRAAEAQFRVRMLLKTFGRWRYLALRHAADAAHVDAAAWQVAVEYYNGCWVEWLFDTWREFVAARQPKAAAAARAVRHHQRRQLRLCWSAWTVWMDHRAVKHRAWLRACNRSHRSLTSRVWSAWLEYLSLRHRGRQLHATARVHWSHRVMVAWARVARHGAHIKRQVEARSHRRQRRLLSAALAGWLSHAQDSARLALCDAVAADHWRLAVMRQCVWAWGALARAAREQREQEQRVVEVLRMVQVAVRWRRVSEGAQRWAAVTQRGRRMLQHRVVDGLMRAVMQEWSRLVVDRQLVRRAMGAAFTEAVLVAHTAALVVYAFNKWRGLLLARTRRDLTAATSRHAAASSQAAQLESQLSQLQLERQRLEAAVDQSAQVYRQLEETKGELLAVQGEAKAAQAQVLELEAQCVTEHDQREAMTSEAQALHSAVQVARAEAEGARVEAAGRGEALGEAREANRELQMRFRQQAAQHAEILESLREELSTRDRELSVALQLSRRLERQVADLKGEVEQQRVQGEAQVAGLREQLQERESRLEALVPELRFDDAPGGGGGLQGPGMAWSPVPAPGGHTRYTAHPSTTRGQQHQQHQPQEGVPYAVTGGYGGYGHDGGGVGTSQAWPAGGGRGPPQQPPQPAVRWLGNSLAEATLLLGEHAVATHHHLSSQQQQPGSPPGGPPQPTMQAGQGVQGLPEHLSITRFLAAALPQLASGSMAAAAAAAQGMQAHEAQTPC